MALLISGLLAVSLAPSVSAQKPSTRGTTQAPKVQPGGTQTPAPLPGAPVQPVTFGDMFAAVEQQDYTATQQRRFFHEGQIVTVREEVRVDADGTDAPPFTITFLGVLGELPGSPVNTKWQQTYVRFGRLFHEQGSFRVRDLAKSTQNYTLFAFGNAVRAGRSACRLVVFPQILDKSIWVIDVDAATFVPLYSAEFDLHFRLLSELEVETFTESTQLGTSTTGSGATNFVHPDFAAAVTAMGNPSGLVQPSTNFAGEYQVSQIETRVDPLNGQQRLALTFTDGVDQFYIVQTPGTNDVFASLFPSVAGQAGPAANTIARYRDPGMSVLLFWEGGVAFHVIGRGSLQRLDSFARTLYIRALSTN